MSSLVERAHAAWRGHLRPGDLALDATAGNGRDTLVLAQLVGPTGRVFAFDIQAEALRRTEALLKTSPPCPLSDAERGSHFFTSPLVGEVAPTQSERVGGLFPQVTLIEADHAALLRHILSELHGRFALAVFNLGYLPGGDRSIVTRTQSSVAAIRAAAELLAPAGALSLVLYHGHPGGAEETAAIEALLPELPFEWSCDRSEKATSPRCWWGVKSEE